MKELTVVVPTFNERANIVLFLDSLFLALQDISFEVIFIDDDSPDGTADLVRSIAQQNELVRVIHRINRRGLASACLEGMLASSTPYICVMDADLQHDEKIIPAMLARLKQERLDLVVGSRNVSGGSMGRFSKQRVALSMLGRRISDRICHCRITDPMSGFFVLTRSVLMEVVHEVSAVGFKILVDLLASAKRPLRVEEEPYVFRSRKRGESKLDLSVGIEYVRLVLDKSIGSYVPASFILFAVVGSVGIVFYTVTLWMLFFLLHRGFGQSQVVAALVAMTFNFLLNNLVTYSDRRLGGWRLFGGLVIFYLACSIGLLVNWKIAGTTYNAGLNWLLAGFSGLVVGSVWNYGVTSVLTWRKFGNSRARALVIF